LARRSILHGARQCHTITLAVKLEDGALLISSPRQASGSKTGPRLLTMWSVEITRTIGCRRNTASLSTNNALGRIPVRRYQTSCQPLRASREKTLRPVFTPKHVHVLHRRSSHFRSESTIDSNERRNLPQYGFSTRHSREPKHGGLEDDRTWLSASVSAIA
jgi:hypothetical protein